MQAIACLRGGARPATVVLAAIVLSVFCAASAAASTAYSAASANPGPIPWTGWHGRPIQRPHRRLDPALLKSVSFPPGWSAGAVRYGTGYHSLGGSDRVREVQRRLTRLGYRPGPIDGLYGPLTRSAVQWFQIKHGLRPNGVVAAATLAILRHPKGLPQQHHQAQAKKPVGATPQRQQPHATPKAPPAPAPAQPANNEVPALLARTLVALLAVALGLGTLLLATKRGRGRRRERINHSAEPDSRERVSHSTERASRERVNHSAEPGSRERVNHSAEPGSRERFSNSAEPPTAGKNPPRAEPGRTVLAYVVGDGAESIQRAEAAIKEACTRHGWTLTRLIRDNRPAIGRALARPGLSYALKQLGEGCATRLVVHKLEHLAGSLTELRAVLAWLMQRGIALTALDVGIDTGTPDGQTAARALLSVTGSERAKMAAQTQRRFTSSTGGGRRPAVSDQPELADRIRRMRASGMTLQAIVDTLNEEGVPTVRGGAEWRPSSVQAVLGYRRSARGGW
jgi:DNA invertase Pin-like site-specific DNA recombinase